jgi:polysaccharide export outer membrane protein
MKCLLNSLIGILIVVSSCTSQKKLAYLNNLSQESDEFFTMEVPDYKIQYRDILYVTAKALMPDGRIQDMLLSTGSTMTGSQLQGDAGGYLYGYDVHYDGTILIPSVGSINVSGLTLPDARNKIQESIDRIFKNSTVECKLLNFKFTVIGEVKLPGTYINYNNFLTVLEAIGRAGGINDYGNRSNVLVVRATDKGSKTYRLNLQDKRILNSEAYFLLPNDVIIVDPQPQKIFNMNLPTVAFVLSAITSSLTTTLLLINFFK